MGGKNAKQHKKTGCGYGYLPLWSFLNAYGNVMSVLPFNMFNFNTNMALNACPPCIDLTKIMVPVKPFSYELKTICGHCKGKIKIKDGVVKNKCKCSTRC